MIELNLTYEESKKILELGYDFAPVCTKFELYEADGLEAEKRYTKKIVYGEKVSEETVRSQYALIGDELWFQNKAWVQDFIPIIPKAALEACLPTTLSFGFNEDVYLMYEYCDKKFQYYQSPDYYCSDGKIYYSSKSAYEAFIWCHKNYPKELKKKFEEVMG